MVSVWWRGRGREEEADGLTRRKWKEGSETNRLDDCLPLPDEDLAAAYLTAKASHTPRSATDHEELELLLENYSQHLEGILSEISGALADVQSTQNVVELLLDSSRNMLLVLDLRLSVATLGMTTGALGAGLLGMNVGPEVAFGQCLGSKI